MDDDIGGGLAVALEAIEVNSHKPRYRDPALVLRIDRVRIAMEGLQAPIEEGWLTADSAPDPILQG